MVKTNRLLVFSKCCFFINHRIGAYVIAVLQIVFSAVFAYLCYKTKWPEEGHEIDRKIRNSLVVFISLTNFSSGLTLLLTLLHRRCKCINFFVKMELFTLGVEFAFFVLFLVDLVLAFLFTYSYSDPIHSSPFAGSVIRALEITSAEMLVFAIIITFVSMVLKAYLIACVNSYMNELAKLRTGTPEAVGYTAIELADETNVAI